MLLFVLGGKKRKNSSQRYFSNVIPSVQERENYLML